MFRLSINNKLIKKIIIYIFIIIVFIFYISLILNTNLSNILIDEINNKYKLNNIDIKDNLINDSLNKVVSYKNESNVIIEDLITNSEEVVKTNDKNIIYIYNTHDTEKYSLPYVSDYSVTPDVKLASYILKDYLNDLGINSYVEKRSINDYLKKNNLSYKSAYEASRYYMDDILKDNNYKILIDIHRDSVTHKYTLYEKDNKKYAKVMFVLAQKNKNYKENEKFVNYLNNEINNKYNGLSRGIMKRKDVIFNQDKSKYAILIELGGIDNTLEEINNTLYVLSIILKEYIEKEGL